MRIRNFTIAAVISIVIFSFKGSGFIFEFSESGRNTGVKLKCPPPPCFVNIIKNQNHPENNSLDKSDGIQTVSEDIDKDWYSGAMENIQREEYNISYSEELGAFQSPNRANNIRFIYHNDGFTAKNRINKIPLFDLRDKSIKESDKKYESIPEWSIDFKLTMINNKSYIVEGELSAAGNKAYIEDHNIKINYTNNEEGMRQDFIIKKKPEGEGNLRLNINARTKLKMVVGADALMFKDNQGVEKMKYSALKVWDANGVELRAYFEKSEKLQITNDKLQIENQKSQIRNSKSQIQENLKSFSIVVNDEDAVYPVTIDPLSTTQSWKVESNQSGAYMGCSVATAGDVNGDGYSDVIVGAEGYDGGNRREGRAFVYHGSATGLSQTANWIAESDQDSAYFGNCVSTAGDVNGDGYSDIIIGAKQYTNGQKNEGRAFLWLGSSTGLGANGTPANADWSAESDQVRSYFGWSVSTAGDVNGDGYSDIIVGAPYYSNGHTSEGRTYFFYGTASGLPATANFTVESNSSTGLCGFSVSTAGDINGDGYSDVIIGGDALSNGQTNEGKVWVYHGSSVGISTATANWTAESNQTGAFFGHSVSTAGDVNGDGYSDILVGALNFDNGQTNEGKVFLWYGSSVGLVAGGGIPSNANWSYESNVANDQVGACVSTAGDVNGDGYADVIFYAGRVPFGLYNLDYAAAFYGGSTGLPLTPNWKQTDSVIYSYFGSQVSTAGDINGDGISDVIIGSFNYSVPNPGDQYEGAAFVYNGSPNGLSSTAANWTADGNQASGAFGRSVSSAGDVNGDGYSDVIVGAYLFDNGEINEGRAFVYHGSANGLSLTANWTAEINQTGAGFGVSVSTAGDVNGDGYSDVIVGAANFSNGQSNEGGAFIYYGSSSGLSLSANHTLEINQVDAIFGYSVSTAGDVNGDGYSDVIVGSQNFDNGESNEGKVFVYFGSSTGPTSSFNWTAEGNQIDAKFGVSVSTAGDVNGDGYSDVIVGAMGFDNGQLDEGKTFLYFGSALGLSSNYDWTFESNQANGQLGNSVSTAGDINGDGYSDVIVGAHTYSNGQSAEGSAFLFHGSLTGLSLTPNWTGESNQASSEYGYSVSTAGDVNGDGYSDVIVGAPGISNGQGSEGRTYVYNGSPSGLSSTASRIMELDVSNAFLGVSVSTAGDVNGDGYSEVIAGASGFNASTTGGRAAVFYGNGITGRIARVRQYKPGTSNVISSGGLSGTNGQVRLNYFIKNPYGRADGKIVYEYKTNGVPFSGSIITNSVSSSGSGANTDLLIGGTPLNVDVSGLLTNKVYKWRARVQYNLVNNPYQKFGPWKYYSSYISNPQDGFKAITVDNTAPSISYSNLLNTNNMSNVSLTNVVITDASGVQGTSGSRPRIYFKRKPDVNSFFDNTNSTGGWKYSEASGSVSPFDFTINYSLLNGALTGQDTIQYFVTAQDIRPFGAVNVGITSGTFSAKPSSVNLTSTAFPVGGTINSYIISAYLFQSFTPESGPVGTTVTISGAGFNPVPSNNAVYFGAVKVPVSGSTGTSLTVTVPAGADHKNISVTNLGTNLTRYSSKPFRVTFRSCPVPEFASKLDFVNQPAQGLSITDFDADGKPDVASFIAADSVSIFRNISSVGLLNLGPKISFAVGSGQSDINSGDLDGDGKPDIIGVNSNDNTISILRNTSTPGNINFALKSNFNTGSYPTSVAIGDLDGDGKPDLAVTNLTNNNVSLFLNTSTVGNINFAPRVDFSSATFPISVGIGDIDGDGKPDIVIANNSSATIIVLQNLSTSGNLNFSSALSLTTGSSPRSVSLGDIDGDGKAEIVVANTTSSTLSVFRNLSTAGSINLSSKVDFVTGSQPRSVSLGDIDGDGKTDLTVNNEISSTVSVFRNTSSIGVINSGSFEGKVDFSTNSYPQTVRAGDLDLDGKPDITLAQSNGISILRNLASGSPLTEINVKGNNLSIPDGTVTTTSANHTYFDTIVVGGNKIRTFTIQNTGTDSLNITGITITGANASLFSPGALTPAGKIMPGDSAKFTLTFTPDSAGIKNAVVNIASTDCDEKNYDFAVKGNSVSAIRQLNLTMFIQGFYDSGTDAMISDTVQVKIRNSTSPYAIVDSSKAIVNSSGQGTFLFSNAVNGTNYYIAVKHRNSIETWSNTTQQFISNSLTYDFTSASSQAFGNNMIQIDASPVRFAIYSGDVNQDDVIDGSDTQLIDNDATNFETGYLPTDINGDNFIDGTDAAIADNNAANFVSVARP
ncbi:MAG: FG-GAP repeat protein [Ignavibacteria bacterium]|nr:FG-GAP repeat protein [Ignavibacteria bacterium]